MAGTHDIVELLIKRNAIERRNGDPQQPNIWDFNFFVAHGLLSRYQQAPRHEEKKIVRLLPFHSRITLSRQCLSNAP